MKPAACIFFLILFQSGVLAQWLQTSGPSGGGVSDFAFLKEGKILAATFDLGNGVYASTDAGSSWHESGLPGVMLTHITANGNTVLTSSTQNSYNETEIIYRSSDAGASWQNVLSVQNINAISSICYHNHQWFLAAEGQNGGMYVSNDDGLTWSPFRPAFNYSHPVILLSVDASLIAGTTDDNGHIIIWNSVDATTWTQLILDSTRASEIWSGAIAGNTLMFGIVGGVIYSNDGGISWTEPSILDLKDRTEYIAHIAGSGNYIIAVSSLSNIYRSLNGGVAWVKLTGNGLPVNASYFFSVGFLNGTIFLGSSSGILGANYNSNIWQYSTDGLRAASVTDIATHNGKVFAATERGVSFSSDAGSSWNDPQSLADLNDVPISGFLNSRNIFFAYGSGLYSWNGSAWTTIDTSQITALTEGVSGRLFAARQSSDPITGTGGITISDNGGSVWTDSLSFTNSLDTEFYFLPHSIASNGAGVVLAIQRTIIFQTFTSVYTVYRSNDNGLSWAIASTVNSPAFLSHFDNSFYMGTFGSGLFRSDDNGSTWIALSGLGYDSYVTSLLKTDNTFLVSVTGNGSAIDGLYFSNDGGTSWKYANNGTANIFGPLAADGAFLYSGGPSVWKRPLQGLDVQDTKVSQPIAVLEVYPNPAGDIIHLHFTSSDPLQATLLIYDEKGMNVLKQEIYFESDAKDTPLSLAGLVGGVYFCSVEDKLGSVIAKVRFVKE